MILYVNGDSHSLGHGTGSIHGLTTNDPNYEHIDEAPHPDNLVHSYGALLAKKLNLDLVCQARSGGSLDRAIRTTKQFVYQTQAKLFVVLGVPSTEREEWYHDNQWYQINSSGYEVLPAALHQKYKKWVAAWEQSYNYYQRQITVHESLVNFHQWLDHHNVPHLFFNTMQGIQPDNRFEIYKWGASFIHPYSDQPGNEWSYYQWLDQQGFKADHWWHYGKDAHIAFADFLYQHITQNQML
jgi:hypothetical protein